MTLTSEDYRELIDEAEKRQHDHTVKMEFLEAGKWQDIRVELTEEASLFGFKPWG